MRIRTIVLLVVVAALALPTLAGPQKPGKWQTTVKVEMPGMPMQMPAITHEVCITPQEAEKPEPPRSPRQQDCTISDYKIEGNTVSWKMSCPKSNMTGDGKMTYTGDTFDGLMHAKMGDQEVTTHYTGKRLGDCDKK